MNKIAAIYLFFCWIGSAISSPDLKTSFVKNGYIDLSNWDFEKDGIVKLNGQWEFYWNRLLYPSDLAEGIAPRPTGYIDVPGLWNNQTVNGQTFPAFGYATYTLKIKTGEFNGSRFALSIVDASCAYKLWVNNELVSTNGMVSANPDSAKPQFMPCMKVLNDTSGELNIVVQVSNYSYGKGGLWTSILFGTENHITDNWNNTLYYTLFILGALFILFLYHLWIYLLRRKEYAFLWFGLLCLSILLAVSLRGEKVFYHIFPDFNFYLGIRLEYLTIFLPVFLATRYIRELNPKDFTRGFLRINTLFLICTLILTFCASFKFLTGITMVLQAMAMIQMTCVFIAIFKYAIRKQPHGKLLLIGFLVIFIVFANDILHSQLLINTAHVFQYAFFLFLILQAYILSSRIAVAYTTVENLSVNLERKVEERTKELNQQKLLIEIKQKEILDSIHYAERIQRSFLATKKMLDLNLEEYFILYRPKDVVSGDFYWANTLKNGNFCLTAADSTGHGVPGAIMSILNITCLEKAVEEEKLIDPAEILNHARINIIERLKKDGSVEGGKDGMDCSLLSFDFKNMKLSFALANNPLWIVRNNELIEYKADKMPVGKYARQTISFSQQVIDLFKGDLIYLSTDGYPDQFGGPKGKKFKYKQLKNLLLSIQDKSMTETSGILNKTIGDWKGRLEQVDDICVIGIRV